MNRGMKTTRFGPVRALGNKCPIRHNQDCWNHPVAIGTPLPSPSLLLAFPLTADAPPASNVSDQFQTNIHRQRMPD